MRSLIEDLEILHASVDSMNGKLLSTAEIYWLLVFTKTHGALVKLMAFRQFVSWLLLLLDYFGDIRLFIEQDMQFPILPVSFVGCF